jgi:hypothetical protein
MDCPFKWVNHAESIDNIDTHCGQVYRIKNSLLQEWLYAWCVYTLELETIRLISTNSELDMYIGDIVGEIERKWISRLNASLFIENIDLETELALHLQAYLQDYAAEFSAMLNVCATLDW